MGDSFDVADKVTFCDDGRVLHGDIIAVHPDVEYVSIAVGRTPFDEGLLMHVCAYEVVHAGHYAAEVEAMLPWWKRAARCVRVAVGFCCSCGCLGWLIARATTA